MTDVALPTDERTDLDLIARWKAGEQRAATLLVERHANAVARFVASLGAREDVEEVVQDTFVRAFASIDGFRGDSSLRTWLFTIARRLLLDRRRSARRRGEQVEVRENDAARSTIRSTESSPTRRSAGSWEHWRSCHRHSVKCSFCE